MTEAELHRAVLADPASNAPRLAYADAIERKDPDRARFIRLQIEEVESLEKPRLSVSGAFFQVDVSQAPGVRADMEDFLGRARDEAGAAAERSYELRSLLERNKKRWMPRFPAQVTDVCFFRGFADHIAIPVPVFLEKADAIYAAAPVRHVSFTDAHGWMDRLVESPALRRLVSVSLAENRLDDAEVASLASSPNLGSLQWLALGDNKITSSGVETIATSTLRELDYIDLFGNPCKDPVDSPAWDPMVPSFISDIARTEAGEDLERRFGPQRWLHSPERHSSYFPAPRESYY